MKPQVQPQISPIAHDVVEGLARQPKSLPAWLFYDAEGSRLFERITELPEYYLTRMERAILASHAREMLERAGNNLTLIELGAGTASKTRILIDTLFRRQLRVDFYPVDVSRSALQIAMWQLNGDYPALRVHPIVADYTAGLAHIADMPGRKLILYLGSSIGNFEPDEAAALLARIRSNLSPGDALLLGADMVKSADILVRAYDDAQGVTAEFNKNMLARINRELGGNFDLDSFRHIAVWNAARSRMEMYLGSACAQSVAVTALDFRVEFAAGERIHTENSYKYTDAMIADILTRSGFELEETWTDAQRWFAVHLARLSLR